MALVARHPVTRAPTSRRTWCYRRAETLAGSGVSPHTRLVPLAIVLGLAVLFSAVYLSATVDPQEHVRDLPGLREEAAADHRG